MQHVSSEKLYKIWECRHLAEIPDDHLHKLFVLLRCTNLAIEYHLPNLLEKELGIVSKVFSELELIEVNESHCFVAAFDQLGRNFGEVRVINLENELKHLCNSGQILLIKVWKLFLTENRLNDVQDRADNS